MSILRHKSQAQSFMEYAVLVCLVAAALIFIKVFMTRVVQEKYRQNADTIGYGDQYVPGTQP